MFGNIAQIFHRKEKLLAPADLGLLVTDMHSHFIPGIDDGADRMETSLDLLNEMAALGYRKVVTTPHVMSDYYRNSTETIVRGCEQLREEAARAGISLEVECAAEYYLDAALKEKIKKKDLLTFGNNYVLFELSFLSEPPGINEVVFDLQLAGYRPVLAHPERYNYWHRDFEKYEEMAEKGILMQLNINSLTGHYSPPVKKMSERLVGKNLISFLGSDCHHAGHIGLMKQAARLQPLHDLIQSGKLLNNTL